MNRGPMGGGPMRPGGRGQPNFEKSKQKYKFSQTWGSLIKYGSKYFPVFVFAIVLSIAGTIITLIGPDKIKEITNLIINGVITTGIDVEQVSKIGITLTILYIISFLLSYSNNFIVATITQWLTRKLRKGISEKINRLPLKYFDSTSYGDILSRVTNDVDMIGQSMNQGIANLFAAVVLLFGSAIMMFKTNIIMCAVAIGASFFGFILMAFIMKFSQKYFVMQQKELGKINGHIEEIYSGHNIVKVYNGEEKAKKVFDETNKNLYNSAWKSQFMSGIMQPLMGFIGNFGYVAVCVSGAMLVINGTIEFGVIVAFMIYVRLFTQPLSQIAQSATMLQSTSAASYRVFEFLSEKEMLDEKTNSYGYENISTDKAIGAVEFINIRFGYNPDKIIIKDFSVKVKAGQKVAIVGPTGAGKTTIVNLLMKFYEVDSGQILIDGIPSNKLTRANIHSLFCMVLQDTWLFEGTIKENIVYSMQNVEDKEVEAACRAVGIHHFIRTLPNGYNTVLNENANLSAGQKQLITIARAMIENAPMLILDEATSSVDTRTEIQIQTAMDKLMAGRTSFVIAHRLSTIKNADLILVMNEGDIIESGTHEALLAQNGFYAKLYNSQFERDQSI